MMTFVKESVIPASVPEVFAFHERPDAFERLQPPWDRVEILRPPVNLMIGTQVELRTRIGPIWIRILAEHVAYEKNVRFEDVMLKGPFAYWHHKHLFFPHPEGCRLRDEVEYRAPLGWLGRLADGIAVKPRLKRLFDYRHEVTLREVLSG